MLKEIIAGTSLGETISEQAHVLGVSDQSNSFLGRHTYRKSELYPSSLIELMDMFDPGPGEYPPMYNINNAFSCHGYSSSIMDESEDELIMYYLPTAMAVWNITDGCIDDDTFRSKLMQEAQWKALVSVGNIQYFGTRCSQIERQVKRVVQALLSEDAANAVKSTLLMFDLNFNLMNNLRNYSTAQAFRNFLEDPLLENSTVSAVFFAPTSRPTVLQTRTPARQYEYHLLNTKNSIRLVVKDAYALFRLFHCMFQYEHFVDNNNYLRRSKLIRFHGQPADNDENGSVNEWSLGQPLPFPGHGDDVPGNGDDVDDDNNMDDTSVFYNDAMSSEDDDEGNDDDAISGNNDDNNMDDISVVNDDALDNDDAGNTNNAVVTEYATDSSMEQEMVRYTTEEFENTGIDRNVQGGVYPPWVKTFLITSNMFQAECNRLGRANVPGPLVDVVGDGHCLFYCLLVHMWKMNKIQSNKTRDGNWTHTDTPAMYMQKLVHAGLNQLRRQKLDGCLSSKG